MIYSTTMGTGSDDGAPAAAALPLNKPVSVRCGVPSVAGRTFLRTVGTCTSEATDRTIGASVFVSMATAPPSSFDDDDDAATAGADVDEDDAAAAASTDDKVTVSARPTIGAGTIGAAAADDSAFGAFGFFFFTTSFFAVIGSVTCGMGTIRYADSSRMASSRVPMIAVRAAISRVAGVATASMAA